MRCDTATVPINGDLTRQRALYESGEYFAMADALAPAATALVDRAAPAVGDRVLDVGAGDGSVARAASRRGALVCASDLSPVQAARGRARTPQAQWVAADAGHLPYPDDTFDLTLSSFGAIWAPDPQATSAELFRVTRPGGTVAVTTWPATSYQSELVAAVARAVGPDLLADRLLGWEQERTARGWFARHGDEVDYRLNAFVHDEQVRARAGERDFVRNWALTNVPDALRPTLERIGREVRERHTDERGRLWLDFAILSARKRPVRRERLSAR